MRPYWLLLVVVVAVVAAGEDECVCVEGAAEEECDCYEYDYTIKGLMYQYVKINCEGIKLNCSRFPSHQFSNNGTISSLSLDNCALEEPIECLLRKMSVADVQQITLINFNTPLEKYHVEGLTEVVMFRVYDSRVQRAIPYEVVSSLPSLREFRLNGARVALLPFHFSHSNSSLRFLELSSDAIDEVPLGAFRGLPHLEKLSIWGNSITGLHVDVFEGLGNLTILCLDRNLISSIEGRLSTHSPFLTEFLMNNNPLTEISDELFQGLNRLVNGIKLNCSRFPSHQFSNNGTISSLSLDNCALEEPIECLLRKMSVADVQQITLINFNTPLEKYHVEGLTEVVMFRVYDSRVQRAIPYEVVSSLPSLREFRLNGARVALLPFHFSHSNSSLRFLELSSDAIDEVPLGAFRGLPHLEKLSIWGNSITGLHVDVFEGLGNLTILCLDRNLISSIEGRLSTHSPFLTEFLMNNNPLTEISDELFQGLNRLVNVSISVSPTKDSNDTLSLGETAFSGLPSLTKLELNNCRIALLPPSLLLGSPLRVLSLRGNIIHHLPPPLLKGQKNLTTLTLSGNRIDQLAKDVFLSLHSLLELDLSYNDIEVLPDKLFASLIQLRKLDLSNNKLRHIEDSAFQGAPIRSLRLANNQLAFQSCVQPADDYLDLGVSCPFGSLVQLRSLDLRNNSIEAMCKHWLTATVLKELDLAYNRFTNLTYADLNFLSNNNLRVDLSHNNISSVYMNEDIWDEQFASTAQIVLQDNPFQCDCALYSFLKIARTFTKFVLDGSTCAEPESLKGEQLARVEMERLVCDHPDCAPQCHCYEQPAVDRLAIHCASLDFDDDVSSEFDNSIKKSLKLDRVPYSFRHLQFSNVKEIDLSGLKLKELNFVDVPETVSFLNLSENYLRYLPSELLSRNITFALSDNPLACDCWHREQIMDIYKNIVNIVDIDTVVCRDGTFLKQLDLNRLCDIWLAATIGSSLAVLGVACIICAVVIYKYSFEVKIFISKYLPCLIPEDAYDANKVYDVFISYAYQDEDFVRDQIVPKLENSPNCFKACIHSRDWLVGDTIPYNIAKSVECSRRTIIVLSEHFLKSMWALLEFRAAHVQAITEGRARVVVVLLEDVTNSEHLDDEIKAYLKTNTYVKWGDPWFWDKLVYALPKRGKVVDRREEKRLQAVADKVIKCGLNVQLNNEGKLVNAAYVKNV